MDRRLLAIFGLAAVISAAVLLLVPLRAEGVSGNAIAPRYTEFGWFAYQPVPARPTLDDLRRAGVALPQDAVTERRRQAAAVAAIGVTLLLASAVVSRRRPT